MRSRAALTMVAALLLSACGGTAATTAPPTTQSAAPSVAPASTAPVSAAPSAAATSFKACQVSDTGGIDDKSFNQNAWKGMQDAATQTGMTVKFLESRAATDYEKNINAFLGENCDMIVTVGFLLGDATKAAAEANPNTKFGIVDYSYDPAIPNVVGLIYNTDEAAMLAGYLAAGMSKTGKLGTLGGMKIPTVTIFMDGFVAGANYYNKEHGTNVQVLGWDPVKQTGSFTGNFESLDDAKQLAQSMLQEGADVILPVGGPIGGGAYTAIQEAKSGAMGIGVDVDWTITAPQYTDVLLTSIIKKIDVSVTRSVVNASKGQFQGGVDVSTLANNGVDIAPFHNFDSKVSSDLRAGVDALKAKIISGDVKVKDYLAS